MVEKSCPRGDLDSGRRYLITSLREKKGGRRDLDKYQEDFREILTLGPLVDMETGDGWYTWNNMREGDHLVAS